MPRELFETAGNTIKSNLLADPVGADKIVIPVDPGSGTVNRGTIMYRKTTGLWAPATSGDVVITNQFAILDETVIAGAGEGEESKVAEDANAYRSGTFINGNVTLADAAAVTEAHKVVLLRQGIKFDHKVETAEFDNNVE